MEILNTLRTDWPKILGGAFFILLIILCFVNINWQKPRFKEGNNWIWYLLLIILGIATYILIYHYLKSSNNTATEKFILDFLKTFLPTLLAILTLLYALSSGLFDLKNERLNKEKANLQYDINKLEDKEEEVASQLDGLKDSLSLAQGQLQRKTDEIGLLSKTIEEIKARSTKTSEEIEKYKKLNEELEKQKKAHAIKTIGTINNFLHDRFVISNQSTKVKCVGLLENGELLVSVFDENGKQLTDKKITVHTSLTTGYPDHQPISVHYEEKTKKFRLQHTNRNNVGRFGPNSGEESIKNMVSVKFNKTGNAIEDTKYPYWSFEVPFNDAEYEVVIHRQ